MDYYRIDVCRALTGCKRAVMDVKPLIKSIQEVFMDNDFNNKRKEMFGRNFKQHHLFKVGVAGCANCCSQPQIKDFSLIAKVKPVYNESLCSLCGACLKACREKALITVNNRLFIQENCCLGCGDCWSVCPTEALKPGEEKWRFLVGGKLGRHPHLAEEIDELDEVQVKEFLSKAIQLLLNSSPQERFADLVDKFLQR